MASLKAGTIVELEVMRQVDFGYFLSNGQEDVLLHQSEVGSQRLAEGDWVEVFLLHDHQGRLAATMHQPLLTLGQKAWLTVVSVEQNLGVFLDMGLRRDLLLPKSELPLAAQEWPQSGDRLFVELSHDRQGRLLGKLSNTNMLISQSKPGTADLKNKIIEATVYKQFPDGAFLVSEEGFIIFLPRHEMFAPLRLGEKKPVRITYVREDGRLNASTRPLKEKAMDLDAAMILQYLESRAGAMPYSDQTPPDLIQKQFGISKAAFKRALGKLMKENVVFQEEGWTYRRRDN